MHQVDVTAEVFDCTKTPEAGATCALLPFIKQSWSMCLHSQEVGLNLTRREN